MNDTIQTFFNVGFGVIASLTGWVVKAIWDALNQLRCDLKDLSDKIQRIEVLISGDYVKRGDFDRVIEALFRRLDSKKDKEFVTTVTDIHPH
jgi:2-oxo-4-hydroxy-4-carboxy--5-ureidoimidazoline (OHCU) decarboxylase